MVYIGMLTDLQQANMIPNFSTRTEMGSVRQKVGIKNWELRNPTEMDYARFHNSRYVELYGLGRYGVEPCLASRPEQPEEARASPGNERAQQGRGSPVQSGEAASSSATQESAPGSRF